MTAPAELIRIRNLRKSYMGKGGGGQIKALRGVDLDIREGETLGLVGESGSGKTTLARILVGLESADSGSLSLGEGFQGPHRSHGRSGLAQMVFQDPYSSLDPRMTILKTVSEPWLAARDVVPKPQWTAEAGKLLEKVGLDPQILNSYPRELSGGQRQRVAIARALTTRPKLLICDEPVSALDVSVQAKVLGVLRRLQESREVSILLVSHDLSVVNQIADRVAVMYLGEIVEVGPTEAVLRHPEHHYTDALVRAVPQFRTGEATPAVTLDGEIPSSTSPPSGCAFRTRCPAATPVCADIAPELVSRLGDDHLAACHWPLGGSSDSGHGAEMG